MARITAKDKVVILDESTKKADFHTGRTLYPDDEENIVEKPAKSFKMNFLAVLGFNVESSLFVIKNLDEFEFIKILLKLKRFYADSNEDKKILDKVIGNFNISNKEITKKLKKWKIIQSLLIK